MFCVQNSFLNILEVLNSKFVTLSMTILDMELMLGSSCSVQTHCSLIFFCGQLTLFCPLSTDLLKKKEE